jgi:hypothetical protein
MAALIAVDARQPLMKVTAVEKAFEDRGLYRPVDQPGRSEFIAVTSYTLVQGTHPRVACAVDTTCRRLRVRAHRLGAPFCTARCRDSRVPVPAADVHGSKLLVSFDSVVGRDGWLREICGDQLCIVVRSVANQNHGRPGNLLKYIT